MAAIVTVDVPEGLDVPNAVFPSSRITKSDVLNERNPVTAISVLSASKTIVGSETINSPLISNVVPALMVSVPEVKLVDAFERRKSPATNPPSVDPAHKPSDN